MTAQERAELKRRIDEVVRAREPNMKRGARPGGWKKLGTQPRKGGTNV